MLSYPPGKPAGNPRYTPSGIASAGKHGLSEFVAMLLAAVLFAVGHLPVYGQVASHQKISNLEGNFTGVLDDADSFGWVPARLGDLDGDGITELAVGTPRDDDGADNAGAVWILFLNADGTVKKQQKISALEGGFTGVLDSGDEFGHSIKPLGDYDGDGVNDIAVGALFDDDGGTNRGAFYLLFLNADGTVKSQQKVSQTEGGFTDTLTDEDGFGHGISLLGDLDGDGIDELVSATGHITHEGIIWVLFMNADGTVRAFQRIAMNEGGFTGVLDPGDEIGHDMDMLGDFDGDGVLDLVAGSPGDDDGGDGRGAFYLLFLNPDGTVKAQQKISSTEGGFTGSLDNGDTFGHPPANAGDLDGDGIIDLLVGAPHDDDGGLDVGAFWILFLNADGTVRAYQKVSATAGGFTGALDEDDLFSHIVTSIGDLNGDGHTDFAAGAPLDDDGGLDRGAVWILFGDGSVPVPPVEADLGVTKLDDPDPVTVGDALTYTIDVVNNGPDTATGVTLNDTLPATAAFVSAIPGQGSCSEGGGVVSCDLGSLDNGSNVTVTVVVTADAAGILTNTVNVTAAEDDPDASDNSAGQDTTVQAAPPVEPLDVTAVTPAELALGEAAQLTISGTGFQTGARLRVCRTGGVSILGVVVQDANTIVADVSVPATRQTGLCGVRVDNPDGQHVIARNVITITGEPPPPGDTLSVAGVSPNSLAVGSSAQLTISGTGFQAGARLRVCRTGGVSILGVVVQDANTIVADVGVSATRQTGLCGVRIDNPDGQKVIARNIITITGN